VSAATSASALPRSASTRDVLAELGYAPSDIDRLLASDAAREGQVAGSTDRAAREAYALRLAGADEDD
jgi:hypothetical protein